MQITSKRALRGLTRSIILFALAIMATSAAFGQVLYGTLTGTVTDPSNAAVAGATITIRNGDTGLSRTTTSDTSGNYQITDVPQGNYVVNISGTGFGASQTKDVPIAVNQTKRLDATLTVGGVTTSVEVSTELPALQTDRADVNYEISSKQVDQLPTSGSAGRNFENLFRLIPGIPPPQEMNSQAGNPGRNEAINANGVANTINSIKIDGAAVNYPWLQSEASYIPPQDAIESANVVTNSFNAEQGAAGGVAANIIVKSGTNHFHGGVWEYNTVSQYNARNVFVRATTVPTVPKNIYNEYGGNIGGPIIKDHLFFFFNYNKTSLRQFKNANVFTVPQTQFRGGDFSALLANPAAYNLTAASAVIYDPLTGNADGTGRTAFFNNVIPNGRLSPAAVKLFSLIPSPTNNALATSNFGTGAVLAFDRGTYDTKINYNPTDRTTFFGRYSILRSQIVDPVALGAAVGNTYDGGQPGTAPGNIKNIGLGATHTITDHFLIDANAGVVRIDLAAQGPDYGTNIGLNTLGIPGTNGTTAFQSGLPGFIESQGLSNYGNYTQSNPFSFRDYQYVGNVNATYIRGSHTMRFGGEYTHSAINHLQTNGAGPRGQFTFTGGATSLNGGTGGTPTIYRAIADNLLGLPNNVAKTVQLFQPNGPRFSEFGFFAQDTWKASSNLTVNYGIRYEYYPFANRDHTGVFRYDPTSGNTLIGGRGTTPTDTGVSVGPGQVVPRFGLNYRINEKTVIRSGAGITVDPENYRFYRDAYPALTTLNQTGIGTFTTQYTPAAALSTVNSVIPAGTLPIGVPTVVLPDISSGVVPLPYNYGTIFSPQKWRRGYVEGWNLFVDRDLAKGLTATIGYVGTHHVRQVAGIDINSGFVSPLGANTRHIIANASAVGGARLNVNAISNFFPFGTVNYSGLQFAVNERQFRSFQTGYAFTWSHALNTYDTNSTPGNVTFNSPAYFSRNYANSGFDRTFVHALWTVWQIPVGPGRQFLNTGVVGRLVGGFDLNTVTIYDSGTPFTLSDSSTSGNGDTVVPYQFSKLALNGTKYVAPGPGIAQNLQFPQYFVNNGNIATVTSVYGAANVQNGNIGRNSIRGPGLFNMDIALSRNIPFYREYTLILKGEAFGLTNTPQYANPSTNINSPTNFGQINSANGSRVLRLSARISF